MTNDFTVDIATKLQVAKIELDEAIKDFSQAKLLDSNTVIDKLLDIRLSLAS